MIKGDNFKKQVMDQIKNLLSQVSIISKKNAEILDATGGRFNMFRICGVDHYENTHSAILAEFLNPNGTHGLKSKFLECFIETLGEQFTIEDFNCKNARVHTEFVIPGGRIDILIEDEQREKAIIIENKIFAGDQMEQLERYEKYANKTYKNENYQILYLTLDGREPSKQSGEGVSCLTISYTETIINWLEKCVAIAARFPMVRETIIQYINHLKQLTNQDMDNKNKEEITDLLSKVENLRADKVICQHYSKTFDAIIEKHFNPEMKKFAEKHNLEYQYSGSDEQSVRFNLIKPDWKGKCAISFTFEKGHFHYGLFNYLNNKYKLSKDNRETIHKKLEEEGIQSRKQSDWWPFYAYIDNLTIDYWERYIITSDDFLKACIEKIKMILEIMKGIDLEK